MKHVEVDRIEPDALSADRKSSVLDELYSVQSELFDGVGRERFAAYVLESKAERTWIDIYRAPDGRAVGYLALHHFERTVGKKAVTVVRAETAVQRRWRGVVPFGSLVAATTVPRILTAPWRPTYYLGAFVHPAPYKLLCRFADGLRPRPGMETPPKLLGLMLDLADQFGLPMVDPARPLVRDVGWRPRISDAERAALERSRDPAVRYYLDNNPGFMRGHGLLVLVPGTLRSVVGYVRRARKLRLTEHLGWGLSK